MKVKLFSKMILLPRLLGATHLLFTRCNIAFDQYQFKAQETEFLQALYYKLSDCNKIQNDF